MQNSITAKENKMGVMPIAPLLINMSVPIVISMLVGALYNIVDSIFVARLGEEALASVGLIFPIQNFMIAVAAGTGVGINSLLSRRLGEKNGKAASEVAKNGLVLAVFSWLGTALLAFFFTKPFVAFFASGSVTPAMLKMAESYMLVVCMGSFGVYLGITLERLLMATGSTMYSMTSHLVGAVTNIILDPIMIFGLFGFPKMGVTGAALATIIGQVFGVLVAAWANFAKNKEIDLSFKNFKPSLDVIKSIYHVGLPSIIMQSIGSVMIFFMNSLLVGFGSTPVSVFSIYFKLNSFIIMPVLGFYNGMIPIVAYNYGAKNRKRIEDTIRLCCLICFGIMLFGTALFWIMPKTLMSLFNANTAMAQMGADCIRIISISFPTAAFSIVLSGVFQAMGKGVYSLIISIVRQLLFLLPSAFVLSRLFGIPAIWASFPIAEVSSFCMSIFFFYKLWRQKIRPLGAM